MIAMSDDRADEGEINQRCDHAGQPTSDMAVRVDGDAAPFVVVA